MCGIAGMIDLSGERQRVPGDRLRAMAEAIVHRGPDEDGFLELPGLGFASRRLSIVGLADGRQPIRNEDGSVVTVFNGELFDYPELKARLEAKGHAYRTHADTENIVHLWEDHQEGMWDHLKGQFAVALLDQKRQRVVLGRDRFGICPLYWARSGDWLLFGSEIKAILASGLIDARPEPRGLNHLFTFFSLPGPVTCFQGVRALSPGRYLEIDLGSCRLDERVYWRLDFPDQGDEDRRPIAALTDEFEERMLGAVTRRLRADVPVVSYLSGGVDSSVVVAMASKIRGTPIPAFTIQIQAKGLDETSEAGIVARHVGCDPTVVPVGANEVLSTYPELVRAAEGPVVDTSCAALLLLAKEVHRQGYKVALTGEGADEWLAGYPWHKVNRALSWLDLFGLPLSQWLRRGAIWASGSPLFPWSNVQRTQAAVAGHNGWLDIYGLMSLSRLRFFSAEMKEQLRDHVPLEDLEFDAARMKRWHPLNRELAVSARAHLAGLLLNAKGDRVAMNSSVETRYPFLDEEVFAFLAQVPPQHKYKGLMGDKHLLRRVAERWLPREIAWRKKAMFRAPFDSFHLDTAPAFVQQLTSEQSLRKTGYFDPVAVQYWRTAFRSLGSHSLKRVSVEMGLVGVLATQLWHHTWIEGGLCDLPSMAGTLSPKPLSPSLAGVA
ncbi:MAG: asparagine synthase (glutamine-hydrolyzing) [Gemmataceae bacterium]|nr:asparagine synthase (glutamine-hydrolyzing) [Gemmataceae bacterium]